MRNPEADNINFISKGKWPAIITIEITTKPDIYQESLEALFIYFNNIRY